jgi:hypothetical protein
MLCMPASQGANALLHPNGKQCIPCKRVQSGYTILAILQNVVSNFVLAFLAHICQAFGFRVCSIFCALDFLWIIPFFRLLHGLLVTSALSMYRLELPFSLPPPPPPQLHPQKPNRVEPIIMSAGELEHEWAGTPGKMIRERYRKAAELSRVRGKLSCLLINDIDAGIGIFKNTQVRSPGADWLA